MVKPKEFDFGFPQQTMFIKDEPRKETTAEHWALLECSKVNGLFTQHDLERKNLAANYEAENLHIAFQNASDMEEWKKYLQAHPPSPEALAVLMLVSVDEANSKRSSKASIAGHSKPGGSKEKRALIQESWATGNFKSRAICADEQSAAFGMSPDTARKALINTPDPNPWPARKKT
jgi:hypothetical protein